MSVAVEKPDLPKVAILPVRTTPGFRNPMEKPVVLPVRSFQEAFETRWHSDAHFVTYTTTEPDVDGWPRFTKEILPKMRDIGIDLQTTMLVLDYDCPGHRAWTAEGLQKFLTDLADLADTFAYAWSWTLLYTTRKGARLVYVLDKPLPVDVAEPKHRWLCQEFIRHGIAVDTNTSDWTHIFRLPFVVRDDKATWCDDLPVEYLEQLDNRLCTALLGDSGPVATPRDSANIDVEFGEKPSPEDAKKLLEVYNPTTKRFSVTEWFKTAKRRLVGRECYPVIFEGQSIGSVGERDSNIVRYVGQAASLLTFIDTTTVEHVYALFLDAVLQLEPDRDTPDWTEVLWKACKRFWTVEVRRRAAEDAAKDADRERSADLGTSICEGMRSWCNHPDLWSTEAETVENFIRGHAIVSVASNYLILGHNGFYEPLQLTGPQVIRRLRITGMSQIVETRKMREDGTMVDRQLTEIINEASTVVKSIRAVPNIKGSFIENLDSDNAQLVVPCYCRNHFLEPTYDKDVDEWLHQLFGDDYTLAEQWLQWAIAFEEGPICALSIKGGQGIGKKLLVQGLAETLIVPRLADASDLMGQYQYGLLESPFLVVNEGWPRQMFAARHPADSFRALVSGDPIMVNRRYCAPVQVQNPLRILFTANNNDVVKVLCANRDLSPEDRDALAIRLMHLDVGDRAAAWLALRGGMKFTAQKGRRWIGSDGGEPSDHVVAKHFLYLWSKRTTPPGNRFLVEGGNNKEIMFEMRTQSGAAPLVIEAVIQLLNMPNLRQGIAIEDGKLYVLTSEVLNFFRTQMVTASKERLTAVQIASVFKGLMNRQEVTSRVLESRKQLGYKRWYELDTSLLLSVARRDGWNCPKLESMVSQAELDDLPEIKTERVNV